MDRATEIKQYLEDARASLRIGDPNAAMTSFENVIALDPKHVGALGGLAAAFNQLGKTEDAIAAVRAAIELAPKSAGFHVLFGHLHNKQTNWEAAEAEFQVALAHDPMNASAHNGLATALNRRGKTEEAVAVLRAAIKVAPNDANIHVQLGHLLLNNKPVKLEAVAVAFQAALALNPKHAGALGGLSTVLAQQGKGEEAIALLRTATSLFLNNPGLHVRLGQLLEEHHHLAEAEAAFRTALKIDVKNLLAHAGLRRVRNPTEIFELFHGLLQNPNDMARLDRLGAALEISRDALARLIEFALNPRESEINSIAHTSFERELFLAGVRATERQNFLRLNGITAPLERLQVAVPATDVLGEPASHESWVPAQWLSSYLLRRTDTAHRTAVVVTMRDEGLYILEWVAHYRVLGFDTIFVYSNDNVDGSESLLRELANHGIITYIENQMDVDPRYDPQKKAYGHALHLVPELWEHEWVLFADCDEFLVPGQSYGFRIGPLIDDAVRRFPARAPSAVCFNWLWYVSGFAYSYEPKPLLKRFQHAVGRGGMKSLVRLRDVFSMYRIHFPEFDHEGFLVKSDLTTLEKALRWKKSDPVFSGGQLNHYWSKSFEEFSIKKTRGDAINREIWRRDFVSFFTNNANETPDNYAPPPEALIVAVETEINNLRALPGVEACLAHINATLPKLLGRFDHDGGLYDIYKKTLARKIHEG